MPSMKALISGGIVVVAALVVWDKFIRGRI